MIINLLGAGLGLVLLFSNGAFSQAIIKNSITKKNPVILSALFLLVLGVFYFVDILKIYPSNQQIPSPLLLIRKSQLDFWTIAPPAIRFHVLQPIWGVLIGVVLFKFYQQLDRFSKNEKVKQPLIFFRTI